MSTPPYEQRPDSGGRDGTVGACRAVPAGTGWGPTGEPGPDRDEERVRDALSDVAAGVEPSPWPGAAVRDLAARRRRVRRLAMTAPAVAAVVACVGVTVALRHHEGAAAAAGTPSAPTPSAPATTASPGPSATAPVTWPAVRIVAPGQVFATGAGRHMKLEPGRRCVTDDRGSWLCKDLGDGNMVKNTVGLQTDGGPRDVVCTPLYVGAGRPARMTLTVGGRTFPVRIVTLAGSPGYASGYVTVPAKLMPDSPIPSEVVMVYDAHGTVLASLGTPDDLRRPTRAH